MFNHFFRLPFVRTVLFVALGAWAGTVIGLLLALFAAGVSWLLFRASFGQVDFTAMFAGYAGVGMVLGGFVTGVLSGVAAVRTTSTLEEEFWMEDGCGEDCEGCEECEPEEIIVDAPQV